MSSDIFLFVMIFVFGSIIGSFLNVVIYRFHTGKSINTPSHCLSCGTPLEWYELFPILSYLFLGGRCRSCGAYVPVRYLLVESLTGITFLVLWFIFSTDITAFLLNAALFSVLITIAVYDVRHTIIPDEFTVVTIVFAFLMLVFNGNIPFEWKLNEMLLHVVAGLCAALFFFSLWYVSKGRWLGLGDAKLAFPLGVLVGLQGIFSMIVISFWVGAAISLLLLGIQYVLKKGKTSLLFLRHPLTIKSEVPFAPFLIMGFLLVHLFNANIFDITLMLLSF